MSQPCPECGAKGGHLLGCSRSDPAFRDLGRPRPPPEAGFALTAEEDEAPASATRLWAFPVAFLAAWGLVSTGPGAFIGSTCFGMWLHELGHALAAWLCGQWAVPLPWFTFTFGRNPLVSVLVFGGAAGLLWSGRQRQAPALLAAGGALALAGAVGHLLPPRTQELVFVFGGAAGAMLLGALVASAFLLPPGGRALQGGLRWGWLAIGAISWADATHLWVLARRDVANLPFGLEDGTESDATKLVERFHWAEDALVARHLAVAALALGLALLAWGVVLWRRRAAP